MNAHITILSACWPAEKRARDRYRTALEILLRETECGRRKIANQPSPNPWPFSPWRSCLPPVCPPRGRRRGRFPKKRGASSSNNSPQPTRPLPSGRNAPHASASASSKERGSCRCPNGRLSMRSFTAAARSTDTAWRMFSSRAFPAFSSRGISTGPHPRKRVAIQNTQPSSVRTAT